MIERSFMVGVVVVAIVDSGLALLIDPFPVFCNLPDWQAYFIPREIHWNERGHTLAAEVLFSRLRRAREVHLSPSGISTSSRPPSRPSR